VGVLANVLEAAGLATVALASVRGQAERMRAPRALFCEFPLGRPLGAPGDVELQHRVLAAAFALLAAPAGSLPVLETFPEVIEDAGNEPLACALPPPLDDGSHPAVEEARGLLVAYRRAVEQAGGRTSLGKVLRPEQVPDGVAAYVEVAAGRAWEDAGLALDPVWVANDIRAYYEEAAIALAGHVPRARQAESWFYEHTETGHVITAARDAMQAAGVPQGVWSYLMPRR
jgi:hypothetical protein